ncbi:MAG: response regulator [Tissierellia bacterium]|nr:response regulator [Tissierellia bacterium]
MKFFILDDDINIIRILKTIIADRELGRVVGEATNGDDGLKGIRTMAPDIVLIDLLMPGIDGLTVVKQIKGEYPNIQFIMISQVYSKDMVGKAYIYGVEYYIHKPINAIEVETIIKKVIERVEINRAIRSVWEKFDEDAKVRPKYGDGRHEHNLNNILMELGIIAESGTDDIVSVIRYVVEQGMNLNEVTMQELCSQFTDSPRSMEQRMRRAINIAMTNIAHLGLEDYMNETFVIYANSLFNFEQVRKEMEFIRGNVEKGGSTSIKKFLVGLISHCEHINN